MKTFRWFSFHSNILQESYSWLLSPVSWIHSPVSILGLSGKSQDRWQVAKIFGQAQEISMRLINCSSCLESWAVKYIFPSSFWGLICKANEHSQRIVTEIWYLCERFFKGIRVAGVLSFVKSLNRVDIKIFNSDNWVIDDMILVNL